MENIQTIIQKRNREIGKILTKAREFQNRSITECASTVSTSRRRYKAIELGNVGVTAAELEILVKYLNIPTNEIWFLGSHIVEGEKIILHAPPGEIVRFVVEVKG